MTNVTITIDDTLLEKAKAKAKAECRSLSQQVSFLIMKDVGSEPAAPKGGNMRKGALV